MVNEQPNVAPAGRYNVTETCKLLGIHRSTLNRATGLWIKCGIRKDSNRRYYTGLEIVRFWRSR